MGICEVCGNEYDKSFEVVMNGQPHVFDSFECAVQLLAPTCTHCQCKVLGHGVEVNEEVFCCVHCADAIKGKTNLKDRADAA
ncbi:MAG: hypothetical protein HY537_17340 [Deltaproteobacteria bacterium]|nr:hypothetical protein [Deltaproteobacteria bacterium]